MSGTLSNIYNNTGFALSLHAAAMARLQEQVSSGSRINRPSDDPSAAYRVLGLKSQEMQLGNYIDSMSDVMDTLTSTTTFLDQIKSAVSKARNELTSISGAGGTSTLVEGITSSLDDVVLWANSKDHLGQYLFGGSNTTSAPYAVERTNGKITSVTYQGSFESRNVEVAPGVVLPSFYVGDDFFRSNDRSDPVFPGETGTGAEKGTGTSTVRGDVWLTVTGSAGNYTLSIDGGLSTVNTDGTDGNLAVTDSRTGEVLYVDTTGIIQAGVDWVRVPGTYDVFNTLIDLRDKLESGGDINELRIKGLQSLEELYELLVQKSASVGSKMGFLDSLQQSITNIKWNAEDEVARLEQADIAQIAIDLSRREVLYQMSLALAGEIMSLSLLDFIR
jgi:flagellar hook-associated protein 3 FlgL